VHGVGADNPENSAGNPAIVPGVEDAHGKQVEFLPDETGQGIDAKGTDLGTHFRREAAGHADLHAVEKGFVRIVDAAHHQQQRIVAHSVGDAEAQPVPGETIEQRKAVVFPSARHGHEVPAYFLVDVFAAPHVVVAWAERGESPQIDRRAVLRASHRSSKADDDYEKENPMHITTDGEMCARAG
jgi:hypothetical protein